MKIPMLARSLGLALALCVGAFPVMGASFTTINPNPNEPDLFNLLDTIYGAGNYDRISDDEDDLWLSDEILEATAVASVTGAEEQFGLCAICDGSDDVLFGPTVTGAGVVSVSLLSQPYLPGGLAFRWFDAASGHPAVGTVYSDPLFNPGGLDNMVSFTVKNQPNVYVLAFEDWTQEYQSMTSDRDFNDFVVEVHFAQPESEGPPLSPAPEPTTVALFGGALLALGFVRRFRLKNRRS